MYITIFWNHNRLRVTRSQNFNVKKNYFYLEFFIEYSFIVSKLIIRDKNIMHKSCSWLDCLQNINTLIRSTYIQQFSDFRNSYHFLEKLLFNSSMFWKSGMLIKRSGGPLFRLERLAFRSSFCKVFACYHTHTLYT